MRARTLLVITLCLGLQTSLCTGGAIAFLSGISESLAYTTDDSGPMSYGSIGYLSCENNTSDSNEVGAVGSEGCGDASHCLLQAFHYAQQQSILIFSSFTTALLPDKQEIVFHTGYTLESYKLARAGPLYEQSTSLTHSLLKRE